MKRKAVVLVIAAIAVVIVAVVLMRQSQSTGDTSTRTQPLAQQQPVGPQQHASQASALHIPAHYETLPSLTSLAPTLPPERFTGMTRSAYQAAREIPQTLTQLPCYCHCDQSMGHKSLHSCFEDEHAASCAVCATEALTAYRLQKEQGLSPAQIRERIIAEYSRQ
jgi:hypothetical protein